MPRVVWAILISIASMYDCPVIKEQHVSFLKTQFDFGGFGNFGNTIEDSSLSFSKFRNLRIGVGLGVGSKSMRIHAAHKPAVVEGKGLPKIEALKSSGPVGKKD